jgi:hypothetical protein
MNRRGFLTRLAVAAGLPALAKLLPTPRPDGVIVLQPAPGGPGGTRFYLPDDRARTWAELNAQVGGDWVRNVEARPNA